MRLIPAYSVTVGASAPNSAFGQRLLRISLKETTSREADTGDGVTGYGGDDADTGTDTTAETDDASATGTDPSDGAADGSQPDSPTDTSTL